MSDNGKPAVVVTTKHRGVFFGRLVERNGDDVVLEGARVCVFWSATTRGFVGLAVTGPRDGSKVSLGAPRMDLNAVTSVTYCTEEATKRWEEGPWS